MNADRKITGVIGLGLLGGAMAQRLLEQGWPVLGFDLDAQQRTRLENAGGIVAIDPQAVFLRCEIVFLCLPNSEVARKLIDQCQSALQNGHTIVDASTGHPDQMMAIGETLQNQGVNYVEASVAGSSEQMRTGQAMLFLGGEENEIANLNPYFQALSAQWFALGKVGSASRFKLVHNLVLGLNRAVLAEGLNFAQAMGFDLSIALEILKQTPAASAVMETKGDKMIHRDWQPAAKLSQHLKDVRLILEMASQAQSPVPLSERHRELLELAESLGFGESDNSAILEAYRSSRY